ncbi:MAG TPA: hypothetical protein VGE07_00790, partial [Herpetosiphonaceae bacterium]
DGRRQIWRSDGTLAGTHPVHDFTNQSVQSARVLHDLVYFVVEGPGAETTELWRSDGTTAGTFRIEGAGSDNGYVFLRTVGSRVLIQASDPQHGLELWQIVARDAAPQLLADLEPGPAGSWWFEEAVPLRDGIFWAAKDRAAGMEPRMLRPGFAPYVRPAWAGGPPGGRAAAPLRWGNHGTGSQPVTLSLTLPPEVRLVSHTLPTSGTVAGSVVTWALPDLPTGEYEARVIVQLPDAPRGTTLTATLALAPGADSVPLRLTTAYQAYLPRIHQASP